MGEPDFRKMILEKVAADLAQPVVPAEEVWTPPTPTVDDLPDLDEDMLMALPDVAGTVPGWRTWDIDPEGVPLDGVQGPVLRSVTKRSYIWIPREVQEATCKKGTHSGGSPEERCTCGLYSAKDYDHLMSMSYHQYDGELDGFYTAVGEVANWGKVVEGTQGWRAQFSYPRVLYVPFEAWHLARPLQEAYGIPVKLKNFLGLTLEASSHPTDAPLI